MKRVTVYLMIELDVEVTDESAQFDPGLVGIRLVVDSLEIRTYQGVNYTATPRVAQFIGALEQEG